MASLGCQTLLEQAIFMRQHRADALAAHISLRGSIDRIAEGHVIRRHGFRHSSTGATHPEKPACYFLPSTYFGQRAIFRGIHVDGERLLMGIEGGIQ